MRRAGAEGRIRRKARSGPVARAARACQAAISARRSATATASVIARQKVAASERNEPKSLSTISKRTSARPASGLSALSVTATIGTPDRRARRGEIDGERRIGRKADRDQRVVGARPGKLLRPETADVVDEGSGDAELGERVSQIMGDAERAALTQTVDGARPRQEAARPVKIAPLNPLAQPRDRGRRGIGESKQQMGRIAAVSSVFMQRPEAFRIVRPAIAQAGAKNSWRSEKPAKPSVWAKRTRVEACTSALRAMDAAVPRATSSGCWSAKAAAWRRRLGK